jgi:hypothetical protein
MKHTATDTFSAIAIATSTVILFFTFTSACNAGEQLYNGIVLPDAWPPDTLDPNCYAPMPVPYLENPPDVIPIDVGRQADSLRRL